MSKQEKLYFITIPSFIISIIPILLVTGPFLSDFALSLCSVIFIINSIKNNLYKFYRNNFFLIFIFFYLYLLLNSFLSAEKLISLKVSLFYFRFGIFSLCVWYVLENDKSLLKKIFFSFSFIYLMLIIDGFIQYFYGQNILGYPLSEGPRVSSFFNDELILGSYLSRFFPIYFGIFVLLFKDNYKKIIYFPTIIFIFSEVLVFLSGERVSFFYLNLSAITMIILIKDFKKLRILIYSISIILIVILSTTHSDSKKRIFDETISQMGLNTESKEKYIFSIAHQHHYETAFKIFKENIFFGSGIKTFRYLCDKDEYIVSKYSCSTHPHNIYIQLLSETGIIGFSIIFAVFMKMVIGLLKHFYLSFKNKIKYSDFEICIFTSILITLWPFTPTGSFFNNFLSIIYFYPFGFILWSLNNKKLTFKSF